MNMKKICEHCGIEFETENINKRFCTRSCKEKSKRKRIKQGIRLDNIEYTIKCERCGKEFTTTYQDRKYCSIECKLSANNERCKEYYLDHKEYFKNYFNQYRKTEKYKIQRKQWFNSRYKNDIDFKLKCVIKSRVLQFLKNFKQHHTIEYLDYTMGELKEYLERQFTTDMSWDNYGTLWHIDHIRPCASFKFVNDDGTENFEAIKECWSLDNLHPMYILDNIRKGSKYAGEIWSKGEIVNR